MVQETIDNEDGEPEVMDEVDEVDEEDLDHSQAISGTTANSASELDPLLMRLSIAGAFADANVTLKYISRQGESSEALVRFHTQLGPEGSGKLSRVFPALSHELGRRVEIFTSAGFIDPKAVIEQMLEGKHIDSLEAKYRLEDVLLKINLAHFAHAMVEASGPGHLQVILHNIVRSFPLPFATGFEEGSVQPGATTLIDCMMTLVLDIKTQIVLAILAETSIDPEGIIGPQFFEAPSAETQDWDIDYLLVDGRIKKVCDQIDRDRSLRTKYVNLTRERLKAIREQLDPEEDEDCENLQDAFPWKDFVANALRFVQLRDAELTKRIKAQGGADRIIEGFKNQVDPPKDEEDEEDEEDVEELQDQVGEEPPRVIFQEQSDEDRLSTRDRSESLPQLDTVLQKGSRHPPPPSAEPEVRVDAMEVEEPVPQVRTTAIKTSPVRRLHATASPARSLQPTASPPSGQATSASLARNQQDVRSPVRSISATDFAMRVARASTQPSHPPESEKENQRRKFIDRQPGASRVQFDATQDVLTEGAGPVQHGPSTTALGKRRREDGQGDDDDGDYEEEDDEDEYQEDTRNSSPARRRRLPGIDGYRVPSSTAPASSGLESSWRSPGSDGERVMAHGTAGRRTGSIVVQGGRRLAQRTVRKQSKRWTVVEMDQLKRLMARHKGAWRMMKREDEDTDNILEDRDDGALKDKARIMRYHMERTQERCAPGFVHAPLRTEHRRILERDFPDRTFL
ncbi:hypothetical protein P152DRAFT_333313 [Eremomyces bilateralis CBS 781.70]|uniref:Myb-like domain-containing protein n=1 Tax=Eremomyces bilateralis CBS 781.70 TaxID=1392243 RepID=A0A6G1G4I8_9PEZI|nr:uncharacterized protein P152DRAFT_333313 [Eremomyces bilateralis CBS 781.70]KAF1812973.1 hypothetical protein P152DRAFT_333313 [Eremomyces bilateralis CBS 781.70]